MKIKKTFSNWLTNRFLLIIRSEENFAEKRTFSFNYAKLIVFAITFLILVFSLSFYLINTVLFAWLNPEYSQLETNNKIVDLRSRVDSLYTESSRKDLYISDLKRILNGQPIIAPDSLNNSLHIPTKMDMDSLSDVDVHFRKEMEQQHGHGVLLAVNNEFKIDQDDYLIKPVEGVIIQKYDLKSQNLGVDIVTKSTEIVKSIGDGMIVFSNYGEEGYDIAVQHKNGLFSVYKNNSVLLKHTGQYVHGGDPIAMSGNQGDIGKKYKVHFELWKDGNPVNPENFISF